MLDDCEFDTIYHEHLCYFSLTALDRLFKSHGLAICRRRAAFDPWRVAADPCTRTRLMQSSMSPLRGCSTRRSSGARREPSPIGDSRRASPGSRRVLPELLEGLKRGGQSNRRLWRCGEGQHAAQLLSASARTASTSSSIAALYKQGRYMPGVHLPIYPPEKLHGGEAGLRAAADVELR